MDEPSSSLLRSMNWAGSIPIILSLAPSSLSSPTMPPPIHRMVSRMTLLHLGLSDAVMRFYKFAPAVSFSFPQQQQDEEPSSPKTNNNDQNYPVCWFEDVESNQPLRWHLFVGILYDLLQSKQNTLTAKPLPWKIRIHFTSYPSHQILELSKKNTIKTVQLNFIHSLKQALFLQYGSNKKQMNMSKVQYELMWSSMERGGCYKMYQDVNGNLQQLDRGSLLHVPVRIMLNSKPMIQRPVKVEQYDIINTLGSLLVNTLPKYFYESSQEPNDESKRKISYSHHELCYWAIQGIQPSLDSDIIDIWSALCCPDHFLYITVTIPNI